MTTQETIRKGNRLSAEQWHQEMQAARARRVECERIRAANEAAMYQRALDYYERKRLPWWQRAVLFLKGER